MTECLIFLFLVIFVEAFTEILVESSIMLKPREMLAKRSGLLGELIHCGYCTSVWVAAAVAWIVPMYVIAITPYFFVGYVIALFVLHRLSNILHELNNKWLRLNSNGNWECYIEGNGYERGIALGLLQRHLGKQQEEVFLNEIESRIPSWFLKKILIVGISWFNRDSFPVRKTES